jgi:hypothetical protein
LASACNFSSGAREVATSDMSRSLRWGMIPLKSSAQKDQFLHPMSQSGSYMK